MASKPALARSGLLLRSAFPEAWEQFLKDLTRFRDVLSSELMMATTTDILVAQGRTQSINALLDVLKNCHLEPKVQQPVPPIGGNPAP